MRDVANAAGVSIATVSNVLNHPHLVAPRTREHVQHIALELDFQPDPHAQALRALGSVNSKPHEGSMDESHKHKEDDTDVPGTIVEPPAVQTPAAPSPESQNVEDLKPGAHLSLQIGPEKLSGTIDVIMPDKSCFWIWTDGGMGRRLIDISETTAVTLSTAD
ncbi:helix-turn-helix domain-containing protein [Pseudarthrobacter sp. NPDC092184]|uniref:helix-turn-helix domain-containing protein n=1 Tax=unclassified Pseudarthrobacter TaxID=2647000 RepID=UPI00381FCAAB